MDAGGWCIIRSRATWAACNRPPITLPHTHPLLRPPCHTRSAVLPRMGWPPAAQEQLVFHITQSDPKALKDFLKAALLQLRSGGSPAR